MKRTILLEHPSGATFKVMSPEGHPPFDEDQLARLASDHTGMPPVTDGDDDDDYMASVPRDTGDDQDDAALRGMISR